MHARMILGYFPDGVRDVDALQAAYTAYMRGCELAAQKEPDAAIRQHRKLTNAFERASRQALNIVEVEND